MPAYKNMRQNASDDYQTPPKAVIPLLRYIPQDYKIWECAAGKGFLVDAMRDRGYYVRSSTIQDGQDFLNWGYNDPCYDYFRECDVIITNPPYSHGLKDKFLERAYSLNKPFALLMPITSLEGIKRQALYRKYGIELLLLPDRVYHIASDGSSERAWFPSAWFCWHLLPDKLIFSEET
jgi:hypothetical protein